MDSIRASEALDSGSIPDEATNCGKQQIPKITKPSSSSILVRVLPFMALFKHR
jgi:hypothetical protein